MNTTAKSLLSGVAALFLAFNASAHHGWNWAQDEQTEMTGTITDIFVGPPHPRLMIDTDEGAWQVDLGNPTQTRTAGFEEDSASVGESVLVRGHRSNKDGEALIKAVRITIGDKQYDLYPERIRED